MPPVQSRAPEKQYEFWRFASTRTRLQIVSFLEDMRDRWLRGYCCEMPPGDLDRAEGGYHFWRCGRKRGHRGPHRYGNYLWGRGTGGGTYSPVAHPVMLKRKAVVTRRQAREIDAWHRRQDERRSEARRV